MAFPHQLVATLPGHTIHISTVPGHTIHISTVPGHTIHISTVPGHTIHISTVPGHTIHIRTVPGHTIHISTVQGRTIHISTDTSTCMRVCMYHDIGGGGGGRRKKGALLVGHTYCQAQAKLGQATTCGCGQQPPLHNDCFSLARTLLHANSPASNDHLLNAIGNRNFHTISGVSQPLLCPAIAFKRSFCAMQWTHGPMTRLSSCTINLVPTYVNTRQSAHMCRHLSLQNLMFFLTLEQTAACFLVHLL